ncbi:hypothetical protein GIB67_023219 [Kingdonia uniflora]|uniref:Homeobox domain-containing protein n=1 Tax=Kingdonia uniflora TaxID=39325 RepID=A0A7J7L949_9MAGN|nr:hypothetical protein GIB67_023219 [Kingdonia uniflora]
MELGLSLGEISSCSSRAPFSSIRDRERSMMSNNNNKGLGFCMSLNNSFNGEERSSPVQLHLLPLLPENGNSGGEACSSGQQGGSVSVRGFDVNLLPETEELLDTDVVSSPNSTTVSSFQLDFSIHRANKRDSETAGLIDIERASDEDDNALARKKLRLSKEQSAFLEESFKEHNTLNPKQKQALAKQLNLRPRQVEVWFQNRRARTKLKQTEVDCEYLKRCCETLTEENRRLQKELQDLRALKTTQPFYMQLPATTLTMCPSCERTTTTNNTNNTNTTLSVSAPTVNPIKPVPYSHTRPKFYPFSHNNNRASPQAHKSAAS